MATEYAVIALQVLGLLVIGGVGFLLKTMIQLVITDVNELKKMSAETNGSVIGLKAWQKMHEKQDDDRHKTVLQELKELRH